MSDIKDLIIKFLSRKFLVSLAIMGLVSELPLIYKEKGVADPVAMAVLGILCGVGIAYGVVNVKDQGKPSA